jgi:acyl dehydratase
MSTASRWRVGSAAPVRIIGPITRTQIVRYAGAGGDFNPIHHDEPFARAAGYPGVFAHGMLTAGILGGHVSDWLGRAQLRRFATRFVGQVWPGDALVLRGTVEALEFTSQGLRLRCALTVHRRAAGDADQLVLSGSVDAVLPEETA